MTTVKEMALSPNPKPFKKSDLLDPLYFHFDNRIRDRLEAQEGKSLSRQGSDKGSRRLKSRRNRKDPRYKTQPITFDEIKEVDENPNNHGNTGGQVSQVTHDPKPSDAPAAIPMIVTSPTGTAHTVPSIQGAGVQDQPDGKEPTGLSLITNPAVGQGIGSTNLEHKPVKKGGGGKSPLVRRGSR